jgi:hypothetical protein
MVENLGFQTNGNKHQGNYIHVRDSTIKYHALATADWHSHSLAIISTVHLFKVVNIIAAVIGIFILWHA